MSESLPQFFQRVTGHKILPYQERYGQNPFSPSLLVIPTGLGKTDAVIVPWLYAVACDNRSAPSRLIVVLPRQNLTEQTADIARKRCEAAGLSSRVRVLELMAGSEDNREDIHPHQPTIIVCTQDLYFSRALNRGYARRPPRWPIDFALYNQDCMIVLDEIQLMDDALATSAQLAAFRKKFQTIGNVPTVWMSATVNPAWLSTVDSQDLPPEIRLDEADRAAPVVASRIHASKRLEAAPEECRTPGGCSAFALSRHQPGTRTLVIANTVPRAREIFSALSAKFQGAILLHSRFRPGDRRKAAELLKTISAEGQIVVATQVLEAGIDITSRLLITDIAPWGSLVQRFGRVNRYGDDVSPEIWWVDRPTYAKQKDPDAPYAPEQIQRARERLSGLASAAPFDLPEEDGQAPWRHVLREADLLDLFDTTSDISGNVLDVSRFIRATEEKDAYLAWREWEGDAGPPELEKESDDEFCPVPIGELREFARKHHVFTWNYATEVWEAIDPDRLYPGMLAVTRASEGGYTARQGWFPESKARVEPVEGGEDRETDSGDTRSFQKYRQTLRDHTNRVIEEIDALLNGHGLDPNLAATLRAAAAKHDWGKAHPVFQATLHRSDDSTDVLAKQTGGGRHSRKYFRHELASALAMLQTGESDLAAYLVATHHGKVRLGIRSMPGEREVNGRRIARGIQEGDRLPACELATGVSVPEVELSLGVMEFGAEGGSWTERMLRLRDDLGPFRLAYLEMLLRAADEAASNNPRLEATACAE